MRESGDAIYIALVVFVEECQFAVVFLLDFFLSGGGDVKCTLTWPCPLRVVTLLSRVGIDGPSMGLFSFSPLL